MALTLSINQSPSNLSALAVRAKSDPSIGQFLVNAGWFFGTSAVMRNLAELMVQMSNSDVPALVCGEGGVGKSFLARCLHSLGGRDGRFVTFDVSSIPPNLLEHELTLAVESTIREGGAGTLFLVGVEELPLQAQRRLLDLYRRFKSEVPTSGMRPRLICSARHRLEELVAEGLFLERLYREINAVTLLVPPLRQRAEDIPALAVHFATLYGSRRKVRFSRDALKLLQEYAWHGNLRELSSVIQRTLCTSKADIISAEMLQANMRVVGESCRPVNLPEAAQSCLSNYFDGLRGMAPAPNLFDRVMGEVERPLLEHVLRYARGNQLRAAEILGLNRNTLRKKVREHGLDARKLSSK